MFVHDLLSAGDMKLDVTNSIFKHTWKTETHNVKYLYALHYIVKYMVTNTATFTSKLFPLSPDLLTKASTKALPSFPKGKHLATE